MTHSQTFKTIDWPAPQSVGQRADGPIACAQFEGQVYQTHKASGERQLLCQSFNDVLPYTHKTGWAKQPHPTPCRTTGEAAIATYRDYDKSEVTEAIVLLYQKHT